MNKFVVWMHCLKAKLLCCSLSWSQQEQAPWNVLFKYIVLCVVLAFNSFPDILRNTCLPSGWPLVHEILTLSLPAHHVPGCIYKAHTPPHLLLLCSGMTCQDIVQNPKYFFSILKLSFMYLVYMWLVCNKFFLSWNACFEQLVLIFKM